MHHQHHHHHYTNSGGHHHAGKQSETKKRDYYEILDLPKTATVEEVKKSYKKLAIMWHPDKNDSPEAKSKFQEISEAYTVLSDPEKRKRYDTYGSVDEADMEVDVDEMMQMFHGLFQSFVFESMFGGRGGGGGGCNCGRQHHHSPFGFDDDEDDYMFDDDDLDDETIEAFAEHHTTPINGGKKVKCDMCGYSCSSFEVMCTHMAQRHGDEIEEWSEEQSAQMLDAMFGAMYGSASGTKKKKKPSGAQRKKAQRKKKAAAASAATEAAAAAAKSRSESAK